MSNFVILLFLVMCFRSICLDDTSDDLEFNLKKENFTCGPAFCKNLVCPPVTDCKEEAILRHGSLCGCCDLCITYSGENEPCTTGDKSLYPKVLHRICKSGLHCMNGICTKKTSAPNCETVAKWRRDLRNDKTSLFSDELWIPECDESGNYRKKQCKRKKCLCFDEDGSKLFGQEERDLAENMTCGCSKRMAELKNTLGAHWMTKPQERCTSSGDYHELQCIDEICYCSNTTTGEVVGRVTKLQFMELLPCYDKAKIEKRYKTQCELQLMRTRSLRYQFHRKNIDLIGLEYVDCDIDGTFASKQCQTDRCVCVDRKGTSIKSYSIEKRLLHLQEQMKCNCARDEYDIGATHARYRRMVCDAGGNFESLQCFRQDYCFCVDEDGDIISRMLTYDEAREETCLNLRSTLNNVNSESD